MKWHRHYEDPWRAGVSNLTPAERGIYITIIVMLYAYDGILPAHFNDKFWQRECNCDPRTWKTVRRSLIAKGKLYFLTNGQLMANGVAKELSLLRPSVAKESSLLRVCSELKAKDEQNQQNSPTDLRLQDKEDPPYPPNPKNGTQNANAQRSRRQRASTADCIAILTRTDGSGKDRMPGVVRLLPNSRCE